MRRKDQTVRKGQLAAAAREVLLDRGAIGVRVKDVADRAGVSPSSLLYYYPDFEQLLFEVARDAIGRYAERRAEAVRRVPDPLRRLRLAIHLGVPTGPDDEQSRILYELDAFTGASPGFAQLTASFFDRQVSLYEALLDLGAGDGTFALRDRSVEIARGIVAMEDGLGLQVVLGHPVIDNAAAEAILLRFAATSTGLDHGTLLAASAEIPGEPAAA